MYEWLCGERPFSGNFIELSSQHIHVPPSPLHEKIPNISLDVEQVVLKALAKEPRQRFTTVQDFATALEQASYPKPILLSTSVPPAPTPIGRSSSLNNINPKNNTQIEDNTRRTIELRDNAENPIESIPHNEPSIVEPSPIHNIRPHHSRAGNARPQSNVESANDLPQAHNQPQRRNSASQAPRHQSSKDTRSPIAVPNNPIRQPVPPLQLRHRPSQSRQVYIKKQPQRGHNRLAIPILVAALFLLCVGLLGYLGPSADITLILPSHSYSLPMQLTATSTSQLDVLHQTLPAQTLTYDSSVTGSGTATGSTSVGNASATGNVVFTYNGTGQVVIPAETLVSTQSAMSFVTQAEVLAGGPPTPIIAQNPAIQGNVPANTITIIPQDSLTKIQQDNPGVSVNVTNLMVTNPNATNGGGAGKDTAVTNNDVNKVKSSLAIQLQTQVKNYLSKNVHTGDEAGQPIMVETPVATPAVGDVATGGTFTETLKLHMTILVVRAADLQTAATAQINDSLQQQKSNQTVVAQVPIELRQMKKLSPNDGNSVILSFIAIGQIAQTISEDTVRSLVAGKSIDDARNILTNDVTGVSVQITVNPIFFHWLPLASQRISVHIVIILPKLTISP